MAGLRRTDVLVRRLILTLSALVVPFALTSCGGDDSSRTPVVTDSDQVGARPEVCPKQLPEFSLPRAATAVPTIPEPDEGWICRYGSVDAGSAPDGSTEFNWALTDPAKSVPVERLDTLLAETEYLKPAALSGACTADIGPIYLLMTVSGSDTLGLIANDYGCRVVSFTPDPFELATNQSIPFKGRPSLIEGLRVAWEEGTF